jgi:methyl-accepting chemotaxis protein
MIPISLPPITTGQAMLIAALGLATLVFAGALYRRAGAQNRQHSTAIDNMSQGLCMFDAQCRIVVVSRRYIAMYALSPPIVRAGCTLKQLIQYRKDTGLFTGDVDAYCKQILDSVRSGPHKGFCVPASDGRIVLAKNTQMANGGWLSTPEDVT